jgi:hypothetical protein
MRRPKEAGLLPTQAMVDRYEALCGLFEALWKELKELECKDPALPLESLKLKTAGKLMDAIREVLALEPSSAFLHQFDDAPLNIGTAIVVLSQYRSALEQFKARYFTLDMTGYRNRWYTREEP